jgi:hypothetical protein
VLFSSSIRNRFHLLSAYRITNADIIVYAVARMALSTISLLHVIPLPVMTHAPLLRQLASRVEVGVTAVKPMQFSSPSNFAHTGPMLSEI